MRKGSLISIPQSEMLDIQNVQWRDLNIHIQKCWWPNICKSKGVKKLACLSKNACSARE